MNESHTESDRPKTRIFFKGTGLPPFQGSTSEKDKVDIVTISTPSFDNHFITAHPDNSGNPYSMFERLSKCAKENNATILSQFVFGGTELHGDGMQAIEDNCGQIEWPVTWIQGDGASGTLLTGTQAFALSKGEAESVIINGAHVGSIYEDDDARYCILGDLLPKDKTLSRKEQTRDTFEMIERILERVGMDFSNVVRTWMYLDKLLEWYDDFNEVRTQFFEERGVFDGLVPASTGIGVGNPAGAALIADVMAVQPKNDNLKVNLIPSPLQCAALDYKSSFARAVEIESPSYRQLLISGTASIEPGGKTVHLNDTAKQIELTMEVVKAILASRNMDWKDTTRAIAYFKDVEDVPLFYAYCKVNNLPSMPIAIAHSDICRDDLLFEIEFDAAVPK